MKLALAIIYFLCFITVANAQVHNDTLLLFPEIGDTIQYAKLELQGILDTFPSLISQKPDDPDISYLNRLCGLANKPEYDFSSEAGKDEYYMLYAYFLKSKDNKAGDILVRRKLVSVFRDLNEINQLLKHGGTYFGHQYARILAYAEYAVYAYNLHSEYYNKIYPINKQKKRFIEELCQFIKDEVDNDGDVLVGQKAGRKKELLSIVGRMDKAITDSYYLKQAQRFLYSYY